MLDSDVAVVRFFQKNGLLLKELPSDYTAKPPVLQTLAEEGYFSPTEALNAFSEKLGFPIFTVTKSLLSSLVLMFDHSRFQSIPSWRWSQSRSFPIAAGEGTVKIAVSNPFDSEWIKGLEFELGVKATVEVVLDSQVQAVLAARNQKQIDIDLPEMINEASFEESQEVHQDPSAAPVIRLVDRVFQEAIERGASDIHITPEVKHTLVRVRIDGLLQPLMTIPNGFHSAAVSRIKLLGGMNIAEKRKPQDGRVRVKTAHGMKDLRIATAPTAHGETVVIRILGSDVVGLSFSALGMDASLEEKLKRALNDTSRVILVTGPTGSGKTSTLYASLQWKNDGKHNIITVEDPIEYRMTGVSQIQVNSKIDLGFAEGLRSILRQDPDVIMVGEIRDEETATISMQAAQTGHLVLSTLHTNSSAAAITRLVDLGVPRFIIASSLGGVMAQRLVRKKCACGTIADCSECAGTGYHGRTAVYSFLEVSDDVRTAIHDGASEIELEEIARRHGFMTLWDSADELLKSGVTDEEELTRVLGQRPKMTGRNVIEPATTGIKRTKLLLVEDDPDTRWVMAEVFRDQLYDVIEAENGVEGVKKVFENAPDIIVADLMMPKMSGIELVQRLKNDGKTSKIPVLMLTAAGSEENELQSLGHGADDFVSKGTDVKILLARVQRLLSTRV